MIIALGLQQVIKTWKSGSTEGSLLQSMHEELTRMSTLNKVMSGEIGILQKELVYLSQQLTALSKDNHKLQSEVERLTSEITRLTGSITNSGGL